MDELRNLEQKMTAAADAVCERKYHVIKTQTNTYKKKVKSLEERHGNIRLNFAIIIISRFLNDDNNYRGGFDRAEVQEMFPAMEADYEVWVYGFAPEAVGADLPEVTREFSQTLFTMRPDISLFVCRTIVDTDIRSILGQVRVPCCIIQTARDASVPLSAAEYLQNHFDGRTTLQILNTEAHLPHLSAPALNGSNYL
ncbi:hypothetical protein Patl1_36624 [Pistacia atlantica]|nr:hypothetical protein Patl1_36624 [Pistacia atlantica]